jgi:hypothetical protein
VQDNDGPIDDRRPHQSILQFLAGLGPLNHGGGIPGEALLTPPLLRLALDVFGGVLTNSMEPVKARLNRMRYRHAVERRIASNGLDSLEGAQQGVLHEVLGEPLSGETVRAYQGLQPKR